MTAEDDLDDIIEQFTLAQGELLRGNPEPAKNLYSHRQDVTLANPLALSYVDGSRLLRLLTTPFDSSEMARLLTLRPQRSA